MVFVGKKGIFEYVRVKYTDIYYAPIDRFISITHEIKRIDSTYLPLYSSQIISRRSITATFCDDLFKGETDWSELL